MLFTHDTEVALQGAVDLVNTLDVVSGDDASVPVPLPFPFTFYGTTYDSASVATK